jgi:phenylacetate-coenzyme A ligase PaaK-like adenylate-forming protein
MKKQQNDFDNSFDYLNKEERDQITLSKINSLLQLVREKSSFYRNRLPEGELKSLDDFSKIQELNQQDLRNHLPPSNEGILTRQLSDNYAFTSGGTTGDPKFTFYSNDELKAQAHICAKGLYLPGIRSNSRVANLMNAGNLWASFTFVNKALELCKCLVLPIAAQTGVEASITFIRLFNVNAAIGIPTFFISLANYCEEQHISDINIETIATGGEHIYPETKKFISRVLGVKKFVSAGYSSNDTGLIGYNCEKLEGNIHHIHEDSVYIEIVDPTTGKAVEDGESGKIIVTSLNRTLMPLIRYDIGDMGRIIKEPCSCGRKTRLLELLGRSDDILIIGGYNISPSVISQIIGYFDKLSFHFQVCADIREGKAVLQVHIETTKNIAASERKELEQQFLERLIFEENVLRLTILSKGILTPEISVSNPGTLFRNPKTGKIKQVIDKRKN